MDAHFDPGGVAGRLQSLTESMRRWDENAAPPAEPTFGGRPLARSERAASDGAVPVKGAAAGSSSPHSASDWPSQRRGDASSALPESAGPAAHLRQFQGYFEGQTTGRDQQEHLRITRELLAEQRSLRETLANRGQSEIAWGA